MEYVIVFLDCSTLFASPPDVTSLIPPIIINITAALPARPIAQEIIVAIKGKKHPLIVAIPLSPQLLNIIKEYQLKYKKATNKVKIRMIKNRRF